MNVPGTCGCSYFKCVRETQRKTMKGSLSSGMAVAASVSDTHQFSTRNAGKKKDQNTSAAFAGTISDTGA